MKFTTANDCYAVLVDCMNRVEDWRIGRYVLTHNPTGLELWISNGWTFLESTDDSPIYVRLSLINRFRLWRHVKRLGNKIAAKQLTMSQAFGK